MAAEPNYYAVIPATVRYDKELMDKAKLVYAEISALSNRHGYCFASNQYFAELYGISVRQIITIIGNLEEKGYIKIERKGNRRKIFIFDNPSVKKTSCKGEENFTVEGEENFTHNNTSINNKKNNIYTPEFEEWYARYPNSFNKQQTFKNWNNALKNYTVKDLYTALANYEQYIQREHIKSEYITRSTNFLGRKGEFIGWLEKSETLRGISDSIDAEPGKAFNKEFTERLRRFSNDG